MADTVTSENTFPGNTPEADIDREVNSRRGDPGIVSVRKEKRGDEWVIITERKVIP